MLSKYLNLYYDIKLEMLFRLKKISCLKWSKEEYSIICDDKCKNILRKQIDDINRMDMMYLVNHFKEYDESSYWDLVCY